MLRSCGLALLGLLLVPFYLVFVVIYFTFWFLLTITGIGPLIHYNRSKRDSVILATTLKPSQGAVIEMFEVNHSKEERKARQGDAPIPVDDAQSKSSNPKQSSPPRRLAVRWSPGKKELPPVCIPNGLGATVFTIGSLHDLLEQKGYPVLSYDRAGVGLSDPLPSGEEYTVDGLLDDLKFLMDTCVPPSEGLQWILVGPSMGSIVCQNYIAKHPHEVCGFLNMDGVPYPFTAKRDKFIMASKVYCIVSHLVFTGFLRPLLAFSGGQLSALASPHFSLNVIRAQLNQANFYGSIVREMRLMMDLCATALQAWGSSFDVAMLNPKEREVLVNTAPAFCGDAQDAKTTAGKWTDLPRAPVENGENWAAESETRMIITRLLARAAQQHYKEASMAEEGTVAGSTISEGGGEHGQEGELDESNHTAPLWLSFQNLVVRVMSARNYDFGMASSFYDDQMQAWAAAEHNLHAQLAADGKRYVFPSRSHDKMFFGLTGMIAALVDDIAIKVAERKGQAPPPIDALVVAVDEKEGQEHIV